MVSAQASTTGFIGADTSEMWVHRPRRMHRVSQSCGAQVEGVASVSSAMDTMDQGTVFSSLCYNKRIDITDTRHGRGWNSCKWVLAAGDGRNAGNCRIQAALLPSGEAWSIEINDKGLHRSLSLRYKPMATPLTRPAQDRCTGPGPYPICTPAACNFVILWCRYDAQ
jgi:hypothetical protein